MTQVALYDDFAEDYDRFVNWDARLAYEMPFFESLFEKHSIVRVLDSACGTGRHAIALAERGFVAAGADASKPMVMRAQRTALASGAKVSFYQAGFGEMAASLGETFGAVLCLGNSLPHLLSAAAVRSALEDMAQLLRPGGLLILQNRNFDRVWERQERFMSPQAYREGDREWLFLRFYDYGPEAISFNVVTLLRDERGRWQQSVNSTTLRPIFHDEVRRILTDLGFEDIGLYGSYDGEVFDSQESGDLIVVARR